MKFLPGTLAASLIVSSFIVVTPTIIFAQESPTPTSTPTGTPTETPTMTPSSSPTATASATTSPSPTTVATSSPTQTPQGVLGDAKVLGGTSGPKEFLTWVSAAIVGLVVIIFGIKIAEKVSNAEE